MSRMIHCLYATPQWNDSFDRVIAAPPAVLQMDVDLVRCLGFPESVSVWTGTLSTEDVCRSLGIIPRTNIFSSKQRPDGTIEILLLLVREGLNWSVFRVEGPNEALCAISAENGELELGGQSMAT
jgi:hypothetical protein